MGCSLTMCQVSVTTHITLGTPYTFYTCIQSQEYRGNKTRVVRWCHSSSPEITSARLGNHLFFAVQVLKNGTQIGCLTQEGSARSKAKSLSHCAYDRSMALCTYLAQYLVQTQSGRWQHYRLRVLQALLGSMPVAGNKCASI